MKTVTLAHGNGIEKDWEAVQAAIDIPFSNGLLEGTVNKIKEGKKGNGKKGENGEAKEQKQEKVIEFVPVTSFIHTMKYERAHKRFVAYSEDKGYLSYKNLYEARYRPRKSDIKQND